MASNSTVSAGYGVIAAQGLIPIANNTVLGNTSGGTAFPTPIPIANVPAGVLTVGTSTVSGGTTSGILWNNAGVLGAGPITTSTTGATTFNITGTTQPVMVGANASFPAVPAISMSGSFSDTAMRGFFADASNFYINSSGEIVLRPGSSGNNFQHRFTSSGYNLSSNIVISWFANTAGLTPDVVLARDGVATLAQRNGTTAQALRVYNTFTDSSNYERGMFDWKTSANVLRIGTEAAGTGTQRGVVMDAASYNFAIAGIVKWVVNSSGNFVASTDNQNDIGSSGANRPRDLNLGRDAIIGGRIIVSASGLYVGTSTSVNNVSLSGTAGGDITSFSTGRIGFTSSTTNANAAPDTYFTRAAAGQMMANGSLSSAAPAGSSSGAWKLGALQAGAVVLDTTRSVFIDIGGTVYKLMVAQ